MKIYKEQNVYEAAKERISFVFDSFEKIYVSFSAGKDSTVMTHLVMAEAKKRKRKVGLLFIDLEAQYKMTIEHAYEVFEEYKEFIEPYWICLPISLRNAVSVYEPKWTCWDEHKKEMWCRPLPSYEVIKDLKYFPFFVPEMEFEDFTLAFGDWYGKGDPVACFVGIRSDESLNRYRTIASKTKGKFKNLCWSYKLTNNTFNFYPIYDWKTQDIWIYQGKNPDKTYNKLYEYMFKAGLSIHQMRICQPYGDDQRRGLWLFHLIEPETWAKVVARVNGANGGSLYVKEWGNINGYRKVFKPENHTWESFSRLLLASMPDQTKKHYEAKIFIFLNWWKQKGYPEGIPDEVDHALEVKRLAPSWRRIAKSLLRNDYWCKGMSFTQHKTDAYRAYMDRVNKKMKEELKIKTAQLKLGVE